MVLAVLLFQMGMTHGWIIGKNKQAYQLLNVAHGDACLFMNWLVHMFRKQIAQTGDII